MRLSDKDDRFPVLRGLRLSSLVALVLVLGLGLGLATDVAMANDAASQPYNARLALVIGNADYPAAPLPTSDNDAGLIAVTLASIGFDVTAAADADADTLHKLIQAFGDKVRAAGPQATVFVYVAGYGLQANGENFLVPVDAHIDRDVDVASNAIRLADLTDALGAATKAKCLVFDLARDGPFAKDGTSLASGLTIAEAPPGALYAFNMAPGAVAVPDIGIHGIYALTLSDLLRTPGLPVGALFQRLRLRVAQITDGGTVPWDDGKIAPDIALVAAPRDAAPFVSPSLDRPIASLSQDVALFVTLARDTVDAYDEYLAAFPGDAQTSRVRAMVATRREALIWAATVKGDVAPAYWTYMRRYPRGPHIYDARRRLAKLNAALEPPPRFDPWNMQVFGKPAPEDAALLAKHPVSFEDPDEAALPSPPDGLLSPPLPDDADLALAPLAVPGALPIPLPNAPGPSAGVIVEPFVPHRGKVVTRFTVGPDGATIMEVATPDGVLSRSEGRREAGRRTITQRDAKGATISQAVTTTGPNVATTVQTGPVGGILTKVVMRGNPDGGHELTLHNGRNQMIATITRDKNGVVTDAKRGPGAGRDRTMIFEPPPDARGRPIVEAIETAVPKPPPAAGAPTEAIAKTQADAGVSPPPAQPPPTASTIVPAPPKELKVEAPPPPAAQPAPGPVKSPAAPPAAAAPKTPTPAPVAAAPAPKPAPDPATPPPATPTAAGQKAPVEQEPLQQTPLQSVAGPAPPKAAPLPPRRPAFALHATPRAGRSTPRPAPQSRPKRRR